MVSNVSMAPDGKHISYTADIENEKHIIILDEELKPFKLSAGFQKELERSIWVNDHILYINVAALKRSSFSNRRANAFMRYDLNTPKKGLKEILSSEFSYGGYVIPIPDANKTALISRPYYNLKWYDSVPFVIDADSTKTRRPNVGRPDKMQSWVFDNTASPRIGLPRFINEGQVWIEGEEGWSIQAFPREVTPIWYNSKTSIIAIDNSPSNRNRIIEYDFQSKKTSKIILEDETLDLGARSPFHLTVQTYSDVYSPKDGTVVAIWAPNTYNNGQAIIHPKWRKIANFVKSQTKSDYIEIVSVSNDGNKSLFRTSGPTDPTSYYVLNLKNKTLDYLISEREWLVEDALTKPKDLEIPVAEIGLNLRGKFYINSDSSPTLLLTDVSWWGISTPISHGYSSRIQYFVSQGYNVVQLSLPGAIGYGKAYYDGGKFGITGDHIVAMKAAGNYLKDQELSKGAPLILYSSGTSSISAAKLLGTSDHSFDAWISGDALYSWPERETKGYYRLRWGSNLGYLVKDLIGDPYIENSNFHKTQCLNELPDVNVPTAFYEDEEYEEHLSSAKEGIRKAAIPSKIKLFETDTNDFETVEDTKAYYEEIVSLLNWLVSQSKS
ncbi:MAG: hypothetical protein ACPGN3_08610 [Opitutales bacterium]